MANLKYSPARAAGGHLVHALPPYGNTALCGFKPGVGARQSYMRNRSGWRIYSSVLVNCKKCIDPKNNGGITLPDNLTKGEDHERA